MQMERKEWHITTTVHYIISALFYVYMLLSLLCAVVYYTGSAIMICIPGKDEKNSTKYYTFSGVGVFITLFKMDFLLT